MRRIAPQGHGRLLFLASVLVAISCYAVVMLRNLHLPGFGGIPQAPASLIASKLFGQAGGAMPDQLTSSLNEHGTFSKYDTDKDGQLSEPEFHAFLLDLVKASGMSVRKPGAAKQVEQAAGAAAPAAGKAPQAAAEAAGAEPAGTTAAAAAPAAAAAATPGPGCPELTKALVASFARNGTIMLTVSDWRMFENLGINWMKHLRDQRIDYYLVGATDRRTSEFLSGQGNHPCFKFFEDGTEASTGNTYQYGSEHYKAATWRKVTVVQKIVDWGFNVLHSDVDVVWFRDPLPYFLGAPCKQVDVAVSTDLVSTGTPKKDEGLETAFHVSVNVNTGVYFVKATPGGKHFMSKWAELRALKAGDNDQEGLYHYIRGAETREDFALRRLEIEAGTCAGSPQQVAECAGRKPTLGMLSVSMLLNGYSYFIPRLHEQQEVKPLGIHMTWLPLSREGKFHRMRDGMLYHDPPEYYSGPKFLTAELELPTAPHGYNQWRDSEAMIQLHLRAMDRQLMQMYRVMAIAVILNRTLILPKMHCFCYKNWFMMDQCRIPGDRATTFPMQCQLDQWLRPKVLYNYGPNIVGEDGPREFRFREHSLLQNPRSPAALRSGHVVVEPGSRPCRGEACEASAREFVQGDWVIQVPRHLTQKQLVQALDTYKDSKVIRLRRPMQLFGGFDDQKLKASFNVFLDKVASNWCCRDKPFIDKGMKEKEKLFISEALTTRHFLEPKETFKLPQLQQLST